jgi:hypothetical protein
LAFWQQDILRAKACPLRSDMPATSEKQKKFMDAAAHNPAFAKAAGVPQNVAKDFSEKSKGLKFGKGSGSRADLQKVNKPETRQGKTELFKKGGDMKESKAMMAKEVGFMKKAGAPKSMIKHEMAEAKMAKGGISSSLKAHAAAPASKAHAGMAKGGGVESKGKTKGKMIAMKRGGKC